MRFRAAAVLVLSFAALPLFAQPAAPAKPKAIDPADFDKAAKPCEDFYQFANGAWLAAHPIPADRSRYGGFDALADRNRDVVKAILEETSGEGRLAEGHAPAEGLRLLRDRHGRRGTREGRRRAARAVLRDDREAEDGRRPARRPRRAAPRGRERGLRLPRRAGRAELHALHRDLQPGRPRAPRPRLLPEGRREVEGPPRGVPRARREGARARRRRAGDGEGRGGRRPRDRDEAREGLDHARREPRPAEDLQQEDARGPERRGSRLRLREVPRRHGRLGLHRGQRPPARRSSSASRRSRAPSRPPTGARTSAGTRRARPRRSSRRPSRTRISPSTTRS